MKQKKAILILCAVLMLAAVLPVSAAARKCPQCGTAMQLIRQDADISPTCTESGTYLYLCPSCSHMDKVPSGPLGHSYKVTDTKEPTCTEAGYEKLRCSRCGKTASRTLEPTGHDYAATVTEPTCTEDGFSTYVCSHCEDTYTEAGAPALGHDLTVTETPATCTEDGSRVTVCSRCDFTGTEVLPATGHSFTEARTKEPSCAEAGELTRTCDDCGTVETWGIPATGHSYGEWLTVTDATVLHEGKEERVCGTCGDKETHTVPKKAAGPLIAGLAGGAAVLGGGVAALIGGTAKRRALGKLAKRAGVSPTVMMKRILLCLAPTPENEAFEKKLKKAICFNLFKTPYGDSAALAETFEKRKPDIVIASAASRLEAETLLKAIHELDEEQFVTVLGEAGMDPDALKQLKESKAAFSTAMHTDSAARKLIKLAMVAYRFDAAWVDYLANFTILTDALGLDLISTLISAYIVKDDLADIIEEHGFESSSDAADLINDIGDLFGLSTLADIANKVRIGIDQLTRNNKLDKDGKAPSRKA